MYACPAGLLDDLERIQRVLAEAAQRAGSTLLSQTAHRFEPQGVTALALLAESHISIHTWPELGYAAADVFTCGEQCAPRAACSYLAHALGAGRHTIRHLDRGSATPSPRPLRAPVSEAAATTAGPAEEASAG